MAIETVKRYNVTSTGLNETFDASNMPSVVIVVADGGSAVLAADIQFSISGTPSFGQTIEIIIGGGIDLNGHIIDFLGYGFQQYQVSTGHYWYAKYICSDDTGTISGMNDQPYTLTKGIFTTLDGEVIIDGTVPIDKLATGTSAQMIVCNAGGVPTYVSMSGDVTVSNAGVTAIGAGVIVNADINASAAIARSKLASETPDHVVINSNTGAFSSEAQLAAVRGGNGQDFSAATGFQTWSAGTASVGALTEVIRVEISFVTAAQGTYYVAMPACTVTKVKARVTSTISGTDDGTIQCQNASSTNMTSGLITIPASSAHGTGVSVTPSANNTFTAGQEMQLVVAKTTSGGTCSVDITFTRTALT